jgi:hypothetical protein
MRTNADNRPQPGERFNQYDPVVDEPKPLGYFERTDCIGSSLLAEYIENPNKARMRKESTGFMGEGHIWEDFLEYQITGEVDFFEKYYLSKLKRLPECSCRPGIYDLLDDKINIQDNVKEAYVYNAKQGGKKKSNYNKMLDEIQDNEHKTPISAECWKVIKKCWKNFKTYVFTDKDNLIKINLVELLRGGEWQLENFWNDGGVDCRQKIDVWTPAINSLGRRVDFNFDIKFTCQLSQFQKFWKSKYIWQDEHYSEGFKRYLMSTEGLNYDDSMYFIVTEKVEPYLTYIFYMDERTFAYYQDLYYVNLQACWKWVQAGKPGVGWMPPQAINQYGKRVF